MADSTSKKETANITFTAAETALIQSIMQNLTSDIQFDAEAVAKALGYKDGSIAKTRWGQIRRKKLMGDANSAGAGVKKSTPKKGVARKVKADVEQDADDDEDVVDTPVKGKKGKGKVKTDMEVAEHNAGGAVKEEVIDENDS